MALIARKKERIPQDLADDIRRVLADIEAYIDDRAAELKGGSLRDLPLPVLKQELVRFECPCRCALRLIDND
jgi:hypothetical protein